MAIQESLQPHEKSTPTGNAPTQNSGETKTGRQKIALALFWIGALVAVALAGIVGRSLIFNIEILVFLVLGWLFVLVGEYKSRQLQR